MGLFNIGQDCGWDIVEHHILYSPMIRDCLIGRFSPATRSFGGPAMDQAVVCGQTAQAGRLTFPGFIMDLERSGSSGERRSAPAGGLPLPGDLQEFSDSLPSPSLRFYSVAIV